MSINISDWNEKTNIQKLCSWSIPTQKRSTDVHLNYISEEWQKKIQKQINFQKLWSRITNSNEKHYYTSKWVVNYCSFPGNKRKITCGRVYLSGARNGNRIGEGPEGDRRGNHCWSSAKAETVVVVVVCI